MGGNSPFRPVAGAPFAWPPGFGARYLLTIDTEEEFDWALPFARASRGVTATAAIPAAARRFAAAGAKPVWLADHPIVSEPAAIEAMRAALAEPGAAVGAQLHPWVNPPFDEEVTVRNSYAGNLQPALEEAKLAVLTDAIADAFGTRPSIYRAGRYGLGPHTFGLLARHGYRIDTSMRAGYDFTGKQGPDYRAIGNGAFRTGEGIVEIPLTTVFAGMAGSETLYRLASGIPHGPGLLARTGLVERIVLSPEDMPIARALAAIRTAHRRGDRLLVFSFHSPSLVPGHTPYVRDEADLAAFWRWWDAALAELARLGVAAASLDEVMAATVGPAGLEPATKPL